MPPPESPLATYIDKPLPPPDKERRGYGTWDSVFSAELIASGQRRFSELKIVEGQLFFLEGRPAEAGRCVLLSVEIDPDSEGVEAELAPSACIPDSASARTRVHEYGGGAFYACADRLIYQNDADGMVYVRAGNEAARPLPEDASPPWIPVASGSVAQGWRFADFSWDRHRARVICVGELHTQNSAHPTNHIVSLSNGALPPRVLVSGSDFYSNPVISPDGTRLAWLEWDLPNMPWDGNRLCVADFQEDGTLGPAQQLAGGLEISCFQPEFTQDGELIYSADRTGWWNLYACDLAAPDQGTHRALCARDADYGRPQWVFGMSVWAQCSANRIIATCNEQGFWRLGLIDIDGSWHPIELPFTEYSDLTADGDQVCFVAASPTRPAAIYHYHLSSKKLRCLRRSLEVSFSEQDIAIPRTMRFATTLPAVDPFTPAATARLPGAGSDTPHEAIAHAFYYPPTSSRFRGLKNELPPLIARAHGGPTHATSAIFKADIQYWTSRGFGVVDVNYRGSNGYGRAYREALDGQWGLADVADCVAAVQSLIESGDVDPARTIISGGSAGGFTVLAALTFHNIFRAGAVYYGIGDLEALAKHTHKFELRYLDRLVGPYPERKDLYRSRSPVHFAERIRAAVIFFQGEQDRVVPPEQTRSMHRSLLDNGVPTEAIYFPDEGHGFRNGKNVRTALEAEQAFYLQVFSGKNKSDDQA